MGIMVEEFKSSPKREFRNTKGKRFSRSSLLEVLAQGGSISSYTAEDGTVRMKILVKKQDLKKIMNNAALIRDHHRPTNNNNASSISSSPSPKSSSSIERRLYDLMRRKKASAQAKGNKSSSWMPVLQSIPEEHY
ncbi:hypothetical protein SOVF_029570 [Spinacia oleracea]|nr:hypothetical protein SOVF_029570 [Spinacia oleracea]